MDRRSTVASSWRSRAALVLGGILAVSSMGLGVGGSQFVGAAPPEPEIGAVTPGNDRLFIVHANTAGVDQIQYSTDNGTSWIAASATTSPIVATSRSTSTLSGTPDLVFSRPIALKRAATQVLSPGAATGGAFTLTLAGQTTAALPHNVTASALAEARRGWRR